MDSGDTEIRITPPDNALRKKIGEQVALETIFTAEKMLACQRIVNAAYENIFRELLEAMTAMENEYAHITAHTDEPDAHIEHITGLSLLIKGKMQNLGLAFGSEIIKSLHDYVSSLPGHDMHDANVPLVLGKHIDILHAKFKNGMTTGGTNAVEQQIVESLDALVKKTRGN